MTTPNDKQSANNLIKNDTVDEDPDAHLTENEFNEKYFDIMESLDKLDSGQQYMVKLHLSLPPYNKMAFDEAIVAIKKHCNIK